MDRLEDSYRLRVQARSLHLIARSVIATAREIVACTRVLRNESEALLTRRLQARLHGPLLRRSE